MEVKWEETGGAGCIKELFRFPSGRELLLVVEGVDGAASRLPDEVRRELKKVLGTMEGGKREPDIAAAPEAEISGNAPVQ